MLQSLLPTEAQGCLAVAGHMSAVMSAGAEQRTAWGLGRVSPRWPQIVKVLIIAVVLGMFSYHMSLNLEKHLERKNVFITSQETFPPAPFPSYRLCVWPNWNPRRLFSLGFNVSDLTHSQIEENFLSLTGIDGQTTGRRLLEMAAWRPDDLLYEVKVGNIHEVYDSETPSTSLLWSYSFNPIGPCLTLTPPPLASQYSPNISIKFRERASGMNPCQWVEEGRNRQYSDSKDCLAAQQHCNTSCAWQSYLVNFQLILFHYLQSSSDSFWVTGIGNDLRLMDVQMGMNVVVEPFTVIPLQEDVRIDAETCYYKCLMSDGEKNFNCTALMEESLGEPLSGLCLTGNQQWFVLKDFVGNAQKTSHCRNYCKSSKTEPRWKCQPDTMVHSDKNVFTMRLAKPLTLILKETEMYPLSQFLADTGGGLGLFLGVCALDGWNLLVQVIMIQGVATRRLNASSLKHLVQLTGSLVVSGVTCVHLLIMLKSFLQQPVILAARQTLATNEANNPTLPVTSESLLVERMASRVLGCRMSGTARLDECVKCLLQGEQGQSLPFISVLDLPRCAPQHLGFPRLRYIVQKNYVKRIASMCLY